MLQQGEEDKSENKQETTASRERKERNSWRLKTWTGLYWKTSFVSTFSLCIHEHPCPSLFAFEYRAYGNKARTKRQLISIGRGISLVIICIRFDSKLFRTFSNFCSFAHQSWRGKIDQEESVFRARIKPAAASFVSSSSSCDICIVDHADFEDKVSPFNSCCRSTKQGFMAICAALRRLPSYQLWPLSLTVTPLLDAAKFDFVIFLGLTQTQRSQRPLRRPCFLSWSRIWSKSSFRMLVSPLFFLCAGFLK